MGLKLEVHLKALEIENAINKFAGTDNCLITADGLIIDFKSSLSSGLNGLKLRSLISKEEEIELYNICFDCNDDFKKAFYNEDDLDSINFLIKRLKILSKKYMEDLKNENDLT